jgi:hypothetical protein
MIFMASQYPLMLNQIRLQLFEDVLVSGFYIPM